jgi:hypothetical protein
MHCRGDVLQARSIHRTTIALTTAQFCRSYPLLTKVHISSPSFNGSGPAYGVSFASQTSCVLAIWPERRLLRVKRETPISWLLTRWPLIYVLCDLLEPLHHLVCTTCALATRCCMSMEVHALGYKSQDALSFPTHAGTHARQRRRKTSSCL